MSIDERQGGAITSQHDFAEYLSLIDHNRLSADVDTGLVLSQFAMCLSEAGVYVIADSINILESYTHALQLDNRRTAELVDLINSFEYLSPDEWFEVFLYQCELAAAMLRMTLDTEYPNMTIAHGLFSIVGGIAESTRRRSVGRRTRTSYDLAGDIVRRNLEDACTCGDSLVHVKDFAHRLTRENEGSRDVYGTGFLKDFIGRKRAKF